MLEIKYRPLEELNKLENNPRTITKKEMESLEKSIMDNPDYFEARPLILSNRTGKLVILAGNQRYEAAKLIGLNEVPTVLLEGLTEDREREIIIRDNVSNGDWDFDELANSWDEDELTEWGVDIPKVEKADTEQMMEVQIPVYEPSDIKPEITSCYDDSRTSNLLEEIDSSTADEGLKKLLRIRASFFTQFNFQKIADYFAHSDDETKQLIKKLGLVIVPPKEAQELGYVKFAKGQSWKVK